MTGGNLLVLADPGLRIDASTGGLPADVGRGDNGAFARSRDRAGADSVVVICAGSSARSPAASAGGRDAAASFASPRFAGPVPAFEPRSTTRSPGASSIGRACDGGAAARGPSDADEDGPSSIRARRTADRDSFRATGGG